MQKRKVRRFMQWNRTVIKAAPQGQDSLPPAEFKAFTYDLSLGGARIHSEERFDLGTVLQLHIELVRSRETVNLEGRVKWIERNETDHVFEMGVEFLHPSAQPVTSLMR